MNTLHQNLRKIHTDIINDPRNIEFTKQGIYPLYNIDPSARIILIGQAPGLKAIQKGKVFADKSGETLRAWLGVSAQEFYNPAFFAIMPMDFYYPGKGKSGDLPPRSFFASTYHQRILNNLPNLQLIILIGQYAINYYLKENKLNLTAAVRNFNAYLPTFFPLPHPSPLNFRWINKNPWFKKEVLPSLNLLVRKILNN